jgi:hypothetical protein
MTSTGTLKENNKKFIGRADAAQKGRIFWRKFRLPTNKIKLFQSPAAHQYAAHGEGDR